MGKKKNTDLSMTEDTVKIVAAQDADAPEEAETTETVAEAENVANENTEAEVSSDSGDSQESTEKAAKKAKKAARMGRSQKYHAVRAQIDKTKEYDTTTAIELIKKLSYSKFPGTVEVHIQTKKENVSVTLAFPHSTGKTVSVAVVSPEVLEKLENNQIDFDILLATPADMPKITKFARILGPKGLMPNPKVGTLVDDTKARKAELEGGQITLKTEKKAPLIHTTIGKTNAETNVLVENLDALLAAVKNDVLKVYIAASMSPSVRVKVE